VSQRKEKDWDREQEHSDFHRVFRGVGWLEWWKAAKFL
jgi:hypothetical protein